MISYLKLFVCILPFVLIIRFLYLRDKKEKEPFALMFRSFSSGFASIVPVIFIELIFQYFLRKTNLHDAFITGIVPGIVEEGAKFLIFYFIILKNKEFDEPYDGILYASLISLGFALSENLLYIFTNPLNVAFLRAVTAVPGHALFGISMGYFFFKSKFEGETLKKIYLASAFMFPVLLHFSYNFIIKSNAFIGYYSLFALVVYLWLMIEVSKKRIKEAESFEINKEENK
ncbi:TPA: PrsW family intramembrane metalloprotease [candidate division WOR-3 bacterium]|jgi:RsiW-degrading membrane proteinase PrsW (M82 family)|uniref:Protease PrsW n=1 Tax=candidate division WOR-3 bacterium TaxID=2052148 RepID=A0A350HAR0_UNCW3|nr:PrsW family intramembrane metalloprotease [candidate division WOR-3 bacterium]